MTNDGYYSSGAALGPPTVPATTVALTNPYQQDCFVFINANGATISNITIGGVATGLVAGGMVIVQATKTISISYTVATPTWVWVAM